MRRALPMQACGSLPSPATSLEVSTTTTFWLQGRESVWRAAGGTSLPGSSCGMPLHEQLSDALSQVLLSLGAAMQAPHPWPGPYLNVSDSRLATSRSNVVLPTPGPPCKMDEQQQQEEDEWAHAATHPSCVYIHRPVNARCTAPLSSSAPTAGHPHQLAGSPGGAGRARLRPAPRALWRHGRGTGRAGCPAPAAPRLRAEGADVLTE